jgi:adenylosuccinate synthase
MERSISRVYIVGGLLFGDEGKGTTVEYLVRQNNSKLVVRFGGGP